MRATFRLSPVSFTNENRPRSRWDTHAHLQAHIRHAPVTDSRAPDEQRRPIKPHIPTPATTNRGAPKKCKDGGQHNKGRRRGGHKANHNKQHRAERQERYRRVHYPHPGGICVPVNSADRGEEERSQRVSRKDVLKSGRVREPSNSTTCSRRGTMDLVTLLGNCQNPGELRES